MTSLACLKFLEGVADIVELCHYLLSFCAAFGFSLCACTLNVSMHCFFSCIMLYDSVCSIKDARASKRARFESPLRTFDTLLHSSNDRTPVELRIVLVI